MNAQVQIENDYGFGEFGGQILFLFFLWSAF